MLEIALGLLFLLILIPLASIQTYLEIEEDPRAGSLSIARAFLITVLAAVWIVLSDSLTVLSIALAAALILIWFAQQFLGRRLGQLSIAAKWSRRLDPIVSGWASLVRPLRLKTPEQLESYEQETDGSVSRPARRSSCCG